jgi:hypothetical protein
MKKIEWSDENVLSVGKTTLGYVNGEVFFVIMKMYSDIKPTYRLSYAFNDNNTVLDKNTDKDSLKKSAEILLNIIKRKGKIDNILIN